jgi:hypothetical protein
MARFKHLAAALAALAAFTAPAWAAWPDAFLPGAQWSKSLEQNSAALKQMASTRK